ncbi:MAG: site-2 protease family protein [Candidatus Roizmanbacteria bacterium]
MVIVVSITVHEFAHALTADRLGDPTPRLQGRISLDPRAHVDLFGLIFLFIAGFGWGKPVQFDPFNLQNPRRDAAIISVAGPISNFILAGIFAILFRLVAVNASSVIFSELFFMMVNINIVLGVFNLIPIHPLDGFKIVGGILPSKQAYEWFDLQRYGTIFLIALIIPILPGGHSMSGMIVSPIINIIRGILL